MISVGDEGQNIYQAHNYWDFSTEQQPHKQWISEICPPWWILMEACSERGATPCSPVGRFDLNLQGRIQNRPKSLLIFYYSQQVWLLHQLLMNYINIELFMLVHSTILMLRFSKRLNIFKVINRQHARLQMNALVFTHMCLKQIELHFFRLFSTLGCRLN